MAYRPASRTLAAALFLLGLVPPTTSGCGCTEPAVSPAGPAACGDGIDNDGDGLTDWQLDLGCTGPTDPTEGGLSGQLDGGWTVFEANADTTIYYVSSAGGDDTYSGLAPAWDGTDGPLRSVAAALAKLVDGKPDWLLFERGGVWVGETIGNWRISGRAEDAPVIIGSYGDSLERPRFEVLGDTWMITHGGGGASPNRAHVRIVGLHIAMVTKDPFDPRFTGQGGSCIQWLRDGGDVLVEDVRCDWAQLNLQSAPTLPFVVRRSVLNGNYALDAHAQSMFTSMTAPLLIEDCVFYHGGWNDDFRLALWQPTTDPAVWAAIGDGFLGLDLDGTHYDIDGVDLRGATSMTQVAALLQAAINAAVGVDTVELLFTEGGAFQLRAASLPSGEGYGISAYAGPASGTDLVPAFNPAAQGSPESTIFNRNMYLSHGRGNVTLRGSIDADGASGGVQLRMGGVIENNLFVDDPLAITVGSYENDPDVEVNAVVRDNVILGARDIDTQVQGTGILLHSYAATLTGGPSLLTNIDVSGNIVAHNVRGTGNIAAIGLGGDGPFANVEIARNIVYDWARPTWPNPMDQRSHAFRVNCAAGSALVSLHDNVFQQPHGGFLGSSQNDAAGVSLHGNTYWSTAPEPPDTWSRGWFELGGSVSMSEWLSRTGETNATTAQVAFVDPDRTIETYMASLGRTASLTAFMAEAIAQSKYRRRSEFTAAAVNDYIRAGFLRSN